MEELRQGEFGLFWSVNNAGYRWIDDDELERVSRQWLEPYPADWKCRIEVPFRFAPWGPWLMAFWDTPTETQVRHYAPLACPGLHRRFAALGDDPAAFLAFASEYGQLTAGQPTVMAHEPAYTDHRVYVESVLFWRIQVATMARLVWLWDMVKKPGLLKDVILWSWVDLEDGSRGYEVEVRFPSRFGEPLVDGIATIRPDGLPPFTVNDDLPDALFEPWAIEDHVLPARFYVAREVNLAMRGHVRPAVLPWQPGQIMLWPDSLLAALYSLFALEITGRHAQPVQCPGCGVYFYKVHGSQKHCTRDCRQRHWDRTKRRRS